MTTHRVPAEWTDDCQGKKDYDGDLVRLSTRYWPRGGGFDIFSRESGWSNGSPDIKPSATSEIFICTAGIDLTLAKKEFEAETEAEVKSQVEEWADRQYQRIVRALEVEFGGHN